MTKNNYKKSYFLVCLVFVIGLSSIRSYPVYGKLDFILLDGRSWWKPWRPMIELLIQQGEQPIVSDMITSSVLRAVFAQQSLAFRYDRPYANVDVEKLLAMNVEQRNMLPVGGVHLLLNASPISNVNGKEHAAVREPSITRMMMEVAAAEAERIKYEGRKYPYRCLINLHGFTSSWVPTETGHWSWKWSEPSLLYEFKGMRGKEMEQLLRDELFENCMVYF